MATNWQDNLWSILWPSRLWVRMVLFPVLLPAFMVYGLIALLIFFLFIVPYALITGKLAENPAAKLTLAEVREHADSLAGWFAEVTAEDPDVTFLGPGPELALQLAQLAWKSDVSSEEAEQFAERVERELAGYKGSPFIALYFLAHRLPELAVNNRSLALPPETGSAPRP